MLSPLCAGVCHAEESTKKLFSKNQLTDKFYSEGATIGDFNKDGKPDVAIGGFWYEGPEMKVRHQYAAEEAMTKEYDPNKYSENFLMYTRDVNSDGWQDIIVCGFPGKETLWYENPQGKAENWVRHVALKVTDNESPQVVDLFKDGKPALICMSGGTLGYAVPDASDFKKEWIWHPTSPKIATYQRFTHGIGFGDVNGDGRNDLLDKDGWYEQPEKLDGDPIWKKHAFKFAPNAAQMYVYDVNGDGKNDVITSIDCHGYGLVWYEQKKSEAGEIAFEKHVILGETPSDSAYNINFSQMHGIAMADMFGDGLLSIVTGKRYWAHGPKGDKEPAAPAVLYVFRLVRGTNGAVDWVPYKVDDNSGVGTQVTVGNIFGGKHPDILVGNKKGGFVFTSQIEKMSKVEVEALSTKKK